MSLILLAAFATCLLAAGAGTLAASVVAGRADAKPPVSAPAPRRPPDYIVVAKNEYYRAESNGKYGPHVTVVLYGQERETAVSEGCYEAARLGQVLPAGCR